MSKNDKTSTSAAQGTVAALLTAAKAAKKYLEPDLVEPGRTVFWNLVEAIKHAECSPPAPTAGEWMSPHGDHVKGVMLLATALVSTPASAPALSAEVVEAVRWLDKELAAAKRVMKVSADRGNGCANFAAHDAHKHMTTIRAALASPATRGETENK